MQQFSLLMSIYHKENPKHLAEALQSILQNTVQPQQFVLIKDGTLTDELEAVIANFRDQFTDFIEYQFEENQGLGIALAKGVSLCQYNLIARFDSDDVCIVDRFECQLACFAADEELTVLGGHIQEFSNGNVERTRRVPLTTDEISRFAQSRNPFNHMTVMFRKDRILEVGNYRNLTGFEDYDLWLRVLKRGFVVKNLDSVLVRARAGEEMVNRRRGVSYAKQVCLAYQTFINEGLITKKSYYRELVRRMCFSVIPLKLQHFLYRNLLRK